MTPAPRCSLCGCHGQPIHVHLTDRMSAAPGTWDLLQCDEKTCGFVWISPTPSAKTLQLAYSNYYTHTDFSEPGLIRRFYNRCRIGYLVSNFGYPKNLAKPHEKFVGHLMALLPHRRAAFDASILWLPWIANGKVLEIGCGNGDRLALLKQLGWKTQGIEPDPSAAKIAQLQRLEIINRPFETGLLKAAEFDAILLCHVIEHLPQPEETLRECFRLLKPGGILILLTPNTQSLGHQKFGRDWLHLDPPRHLYLFNQENLSSLLKKTGFPQPTCSSSIRDANWTLGGSLALRKRNTYQIGSLPLLDKLLGFKMMYQEWFVMKTRPLSGEDLLCIATKPL